MDQSLASKLEQIGKAFCIDMPFVSYEEIKNGIVNSTYKVNYRTSEGGEKSFLVQRINTVAFTKPVELMENIDRVTTFFHEKNPSAVYLHYHHTADRKNYIMDETGFWRMCNYVKSVTFNASDDLNVIRRTGEAFGEFQMALNDFDAGLLHYTIADFHNTRKRYAALKADIERNVSGRADEVREEIDWILSVEDTACTLTDLYDRGELPLRVTHNDTKINNVLFDGDTLQPLVVIDLDTVMPGLMGHDFGDAIRFAANYTEEDSEDTDRTGVNLDIFRAFTEGFVSKTASSMTKAEAETLAVSCFCLTAELVVRFLNDYINGDVYFSCKKERHNLIRTRCQIALAKDMLKKLDEMKAICAECCAKYN